MRLALGFHRRHRKRLAGALVRHRTQAVNRVRQDAWDRRARGWAGLIHYRRLHQKVELPRGRGSNCHSMA